MHCISHPNLEAVRTCGICGAGLCGPCGVSSLYVWENKPLCHDCNLRLAQELLEGAELEVRSAKRRLVFLSIGFVAGAILAFATDSLGMFVSIAGFVGFLVAWRHAGPVGFSFSSPADILLSLFKLQGRIILCTIVGVVLAPFLLVATILRLRRSRREAAELAEDVRSLSGGDRTASLGATDRGAASGTREERKARRTTERACLVRYFGLWKRMSFPSSAESPVVPGCRPVVHSSATPPARGGSSSRGAVLSARDALSALDARIEQRRHALDSREK